MKRTRLRNRFLKDMSDSNRVAYNTQRNYCVSLIRKAKKSYYSNLDHKKIVDNKTFWKTIKPFFTDKDVNHDNITLVENEETVSDNKEISETLNNFFSEVVTNLNLPQYHDPTVNVDDIEDPVARTVEKYKNHPSIRLIKENYRNTNNTFHFENVSVKDIEKELKNLLSSKAAQDTDIPTKVIKPNIDIFTPILSDEFNKSLALGIFPSSMKLANITPVFKKDDRTDKSNYRPISILPNLSKVFEKCIYNQLSIFFEKVLSKYQCGFRKDFSAQHCLLKLLEQWKESVDQGLVFGALLTDLSKAFDCLSHELLIAKLSAYGMEDSAVRFVSDYLTNRKQRTKIGNNYSSWRDVLFGVPQGSILGPLLFNIYLCDLFLLVCNIDVASYADDTTPYVTGDNIESTVRQLEQAAKLLFQWFSDNQMKGNEDKCHVLISTKENVCVNIGTTQITNSACEKLLGIKVDSSLNFEDHIGSICKKAGAKLNALTRIANHMPFQKRKLLVNAFFTSQFSYCPLTWMFHSRKLNNKINRLHGRCLRVVYNDRLSTFQELLNKDNSVSIHHRNIQCLATEMFKVHLGEAPQILNEVFPLSEPSAYNQRFQTEFSTRPIRTVHHGSNSLRYLGPKIWEIVPSEIKCCKRVDVFKSKIQKWQPLNCPCRLYDTYIHQVGFI